MGRLFEDSKEFKHTDFSDQRFPEGDYEGCIFTSCKFPNSDLSGSNFGECRFVDCDLSMAILKGVTLRDIHFENCKLLGVKFEACNELLFSVGFRQCQMDFASFFNRSLQRTEFNDCRMLEVDFTEADLSEALFPQCDLSGAIFLHTNLEECDFRTAVNYQMDPEKNRMKKAKFSLEGLGGLLLKYDLEIENLG
jgi:uncharacterized protein YjbI with pentapeptide repeats